MVSASVALGDHAKPKRVETQVYLGTHLVKIGLSKLQQHDSKVSVPSLSQSSIDVCDGPAHQAGWTASPKSHRQTAASNHKPNFVFGPKKFAYATYSNSKQEDRPHPPTRAVGLTEKNLKTNSERLVMKPKRRPIGEAKQFHSSKFVPDPEMRHTGSTIFDNIPNISIPMHGSRRLSQIVDTKGIL